MSGSIPRDFSLKKAVLSGIAFIASFMMLLALCYSLVVVEKGVYSFGYRVGTTLVAENGFTMLKFDTELMLNSYHWGAVLIGLLCLLQLLASIALIIGNIISFLLAKKRVNNVITMLGVIGNIVFSFFYMLEGIIWVVLSSGDAITFAYLPFIFAVLIAVAYFVCLVAIKEKGNTRAASLYTDHGTYAYDPVTGQPISQQQSAEHGAAPTNEGAETSPVQGTLSPERADMLLMNFRNFIPEEKVPAFRHALGKASANSYTAISMAPLKNPMTVLLFSIFLGGFGVDRFYIGDTGMGVGKLLAGWLTFGIWPLVDIFLCYKKAKEQNFALLMSTLHMPTM